MRSSLLLCAFYAVGCGPAVEVPGGEGAEATTSGSTGGPPMGTSSTTAVTTTTPATSTVTTIDPGSSSDSSSSRGYIEDPDGAVCICECDVWAQDCPRGEKCNPWANDGGNSWNATRCVPVDADPGAPGDPCTVDGSGVSGLDSCEVGAMCWDVDPETSTGVCVGFCEGNEGDPECPSSTSCVISNEGVIILCLPVCDPMLDDCAEGEACHPQAQDGSFVCVPSVGSRSGYGDPCDVALCDPGLACVASSQLEGVGACTLDVAGCCTPWCDLAAADPDAACPDQALGQACVPYYEAGEAPPGFENVGVCVISV